MEQMEYNTERELTTQDVINNTNREIEELRKSVDSLYEVKARYEESHAANEVIANYDREINKRLTEILGLTKKRDLLEAQMKSESIQR
jgi:flagellar biosynthesis regulator FlaF